MPDSRPRSAIALTDPALRRWLTHADRCCVRCRREVTRIAVRGDDDHLIIAEGTLEVTADERDDDAFTRNTVSLTATQTVRLMLCSDVHDRSST